MITQIKTVAKFTFMNHIRTKSFWFMLVSPIIFVLIGAGIAYLVSSPDVNKTPTVAVISSEATRSAIKSDKDDLNIKVSKITDNNKANQALTDGSIDAVLVVNQQDAILTTQPKSEKVDKTDLQGFLQKLTFADRAKQFGLTDEQTTSLSQQFPLKNTVINNGKKENGQATNAFNAAIGFAITFIVFMVILPYANILANEIANEKSSRIMETLLAASSAKSQFYGKILGVLLLPFVQFGVYALAFTGMYFYFKNQSFIQELLSSIPHINPWTLVYTFVFVIVGILLYLVLAAITASLVNDNAQIQQALQPITLLAMVPYVLSFTFLSGSSGGILVKILSYVPFMSQSLMPSKLITQSTGWPLALLSLLISIVALGLIIYYGEKLYAKNVLSYSDENIMKQLMRQLKRQA